VRRPPADPRRGVRPAAMPENAPTMIANPQGDLDRSMRPDSSGPVRRLSNPRPGRRLRCRCSAEDRAHLAKRGALPELGTEQVLEVQEELVGHRDRSNLADRGGTG